MSDSKTEYVLSRDPAVLERAHAFFNTHGFDTTHLHFPVIMALRDGRVIGALGTQVPNDIIVAGPFVVDVPGGINGPVAYTLVTKYLTVMRNLGIQEFYAFVEKDNTQYKTMLETLFQIEPCAYHDESYWYKVPTHGK